MHANGTHPCMWGLRCVQFAVTLLTYSAARMQYVVVVVRKHRMAAIKENVSDSGGGGGGGGWTAWNLRVVRSAGDLRDLHKFQVENSLHHTTFGFWGQDAAACACMCVQDFCKGMAASPSAPKTKTTSIVHVRLKAFVRGGGGGGGGNRGTTASEGTITMEQTFSTLCQSNQPSHLN